MKTHVPTKEQERAFETVVNAINRAKKKGLRFYAQQWNLVAFRMEADEYIHEDLEGCYTPNSVYNGAVPHLSSTVLSDSGADDTINYRSTEDQEKYNPENL